MRHHAVLNFMKRKNPKNFVLNYSGCKISLARAQLVTSLTSAKISVSQVNVVSHADVFRGARISSRAPLKTPAWEAKVNAG